MELHEMHSNKQVEKTVRWNKTFYYCKLQFYKKRKH